MHRAALDSVSGTMEVCILCRHGESTYNVAGLANGDPSVDVALSPRGVEQARSLVQELQRFRVDLVLHSRFPRAIETARLAVGAAAKVPMVTEPLLDDIGCGEMEGALVKDEHAWRSRHGRDREPPGAESIRKASFRIAKGLLRVADRREKTVAVVTHELVVRYALNAAAGSEDISLPWREVPNATPFVFERGELVAAAERIHSHARGPWGSAVPGPAANGG